MNRYAVVSSVRLTESPQPYSWASINCLPRQLSIVLQTRTIKFKWDPFSRKIILYVSLGIRLHEGFILHVQIDLVSRNRVSPELAYPRGNSISISIYPPPRKITTDG